MFRLLGIWCNLADAVRITSLDVPRTAWQEVTLNCRYDLDEGEKLYNVKWYKDDKEFFRCFADGTVQDFPLSDIRIYGGSTAHKGSCHFDLTALTERSGGDYKCEVSLDWPTFRTVSQAKRLRIVQPVEVVETDHTVESTGGWIDNLPKILMCSMGSVLYNIIKCFISLERTMAVVPSRGNKNDVVLVYTKRILNIM